MDRAYSLINFKAVEDDSKVVLTGIASTPSPDRMSDIVVPEGAQFKLPIPLLWQHDASQPIGHVVRAKVTKSGIEVTAELLKGVTAKIDEYVSLIKAGLVRGLSIGFRGLDVEPIKDSWGVKFKTWEWLELSAVTIPANSEASITSIKSIDSALLAASGRKKGGDTPGVSGKTDHLPVVKSSNPQNGKTEMKTIAEQIKAFEEQRALKAAEMTEIMQKSAETGETLDPEQAERYDTLETEVKSIDKHLGRLRNAENLAAASAKSVEGKSVERAPALSTTVKAPKAEPGIRFARIVKCLGMAQGNVVGALEVAKSIYGDRDPSIAATLKANVVAGATVSGNWAENLVGTETSAFADFVEYLRPMTILGKFGSNGIPSLRAVPFRVALVGQTAGGAGYWVGEGKPAPLTALDFSRSTLEPLKVANIAVLTKEIIRDSSPSAEAIVRDQLAAALRARMDLDFIDPAKAASAGVSPASILNGLTPIASTGATADAIREDMRLLFSAFIAANNAPTSGVWIMPSTIALGLSLMVNALGQPEFPGINMNGGTLGGLPVITSEYMPTVSGGSYVAIVNAQDIYLGDEGGLAVDMSTEASLQMLDNPTNDTVTPTATTMVSMFQTGSVAFRAERTINWARRRDSSVQYLSGVNWGS